MNQQTSTSTGQAVQYLKVPTEDQRDIVTIRSEAMAAKANASSYVIDSDLMLEVANEELKSVSAAIKTLDAVRETIVKPLRDATDAARMLFKLPMEQLDDAKTMLKSKILTYHTQVEDRRRAEEAAHAAELEAERARIAQEAASLDEKLADGEITADEFISREEILQAQQLSTEVVMPVATTSAPTLSSENQQRAHGITESYKAEITDLPDFLEWFAKELRSNAGRISEKTLAAKDIKVTELKNLGNATKGKLEIPGVKFVLEKQLRASSK